MYIMSNNNDYLLLSLFNDMYNNNNRTIDNLIDQNNNIRNNIMEIHRNNRRNYFPLNTRYNNRATLVNNNIPTDNNIQPDNNIPNMRTTIPNMRTNNLYDASNNRVPFLFTYSTVLPNTNFFDSVNVTPNNQQINIATRTLMYCDIMNPVNTSCPISLEPFNDSSIVTIIRHCRHIFNTESLSNWFRTNCRCPVCRYDIRDYTQLNEHNTESINENNNEITETNINEDITNTTSGNTTSGNTTSGRNTTSGHTTSGHTTSPLADFSFTFNTNEDFPQITNTQISSLVTELFNNYRRQQ